MLPQSPRPSLGYAIHRERETGRWSAQTVTSQEGKAAAAAAGGGGVSEGTHVSESHNELTTEPKVAPLKLGPRN